MEAVLEYFMIISRVLLRLKTTHTEHVTIASLWVKNWTQISTKQISSTEHLHLNYNDNGLNEDWILEENRTVCMLNVNLVLHCKHCMLSLVLTAAVWCVRVRMALAQWGWEALAGTQCHRTAQTVQLRKISEKINKILQFDSYLVFPPNECSWFAAFFQAYKFHSNKMYVGVVSLWWSSKEQLLN